MTLNISFGKFQETPGHFFQLVLATALAPWGHFLDFFRHTIALLALTIIICFLACYLIVEYRQIGKVSLRRLLLTVFLAGVFFLQTGTFYASHWAGRECSVVLKDGRFETGDYFRFVGEGHIIRLGSRIYFVSKDQVKEIICGHFKITKPQSS